MDKVQCSSQYPSHLQSAQHEGNANKAVLVKSIKPQRLMLSHQVHQTTVNDRRSITEREGPIRVRIVGGGPTAFWAALHTKGRNNEANIEIFEKRSQYSRTHTVNIDDSSFESIDSFHHPIISPRLNALRKKIIDYGGKISCNEFESDLQAIALQAGIIIKHGEKNEVVAVADGVLYCKGDGNESDPVEYDVLIAADGAHSKGRKALLKMVDNPNTEDATINFSHLSKEDEDSEFAKKEVMQYRVRLKYKVQGMTHRIGHTWGNWLRLTYPLFKLFHSCIDESIGQPDSQNQRVVTVDFFISKDEYESMKGFHLTKPANIQTPELAPLLKEKIERWLAIKQKYCGECVVVGTEEITPYCISAFHARKVAQVTPKKNLVVLVGDAQTSLPYFRSLNNGLLNGAELGNKLSGCTKVNLTEVGKTFQKYSDRRAWYEICKAKMKNLCVSVVNGLLTFSDKMPLQFLYWQPLGKSCKDKCTVKLKDRTVQAPVKEAEKPSTVDYVWSSILKTTIGRPKFLFNPVGYKLSLYAFFINTPHKDLCQALHTAYQTNKLSEKKIKECLELATAGDQDSPLEDRQIAILRAIFNYVTKSSDDDRSEQWAVVEKCLCSLRKRQHA